MSMNPEQLKEMNEIKWWHKIELDGATTNGPDASKSKLQAIQMPEDLTGKSVIDVGAWDGFFSFEAERRGAKVLAIDTVMWQEEHKTFTTKKAGFNFARKMLNSKVEDKETEVMDLSKDVGEFDLVLCLGILYHMKDPFGMCREMFDITKEGGMLILETHCDALEETKPGMIFYPTNEWNNDPTNWWGPNIKCVQEMLKVAGFIKVDLINLTNQRGIFHAFK